MKVAVDVRTRPAKSWIFGAVGDPSASLTFSSCVLLMIRWRYFRYLQINRQTFCSLSGDDVTDESDDDNYDVTDDDNP